MAATERDVAFWEITPTGFVDARPEDDLLHPAENAAKEGDSVSETQYFGFSVPEERIHGFAYMWHHPHLHVVTGGVWAWQGRKRHNFQSELFDWVTYENDACLAGDLHRYRLSNGYEVTTIEPLRRHRIAYSDADRGNSFEVELEATMPPALMENAMHFEQGMRTRGEITLGGRSYEVDGFTVRDRSWGHQRPERHQPLPPMAWMNCVFGEDLAFGCTAYDSLDTDPEWKGELELPAGGNSKGGWIWSDGELATITGARKRTWREPDSLLPTSAEMTLTDSRGREHELRAEMVSGANWRTWMNFDAAYCTTRWELDGRVSYGDFQEAQWWDYVRLFMGRDPLDAADPAEAEGR